MDNKLTEKIQSWLDTPEDNRDYDLGALFLLQLSNNQIMYRNISRNAKKHAQFIEHQINKYMKFRVATLTHEQVAEMQKKVDMINSLRHLDRGETGSKEPDKPTVSTNTEVSSIQKILPLRTEWALMKRAEGLPTATKTTSSSKQERGSTMTLSL